ncbi:MAG: dihydropteroate synthase [Dysgonamonadaceae bacterium]|jgi:dihydropteroate synthase|nr:dihydropteroate synthase [Dysgonamonadaceae bacterium]
MYINVKGQLMDLSSPKVMGILNITPDSFYAGSRQQTESEIILRAKQILEEGGEIIDAGAYSTRPGAVYVDEEEEMQRLDYGLRILCREYPDAIVSVDTFRAGIARRCVEEHGVAIVNDISAGELDGRMFDTIASLRVPYIIMHMRGTPQTMTQLTEYGNFRQEVLLYFARKIAQLNQLGVNDIILDPGFGFSKNTEQNYTLMKMSEEFRIFGLPLLVGISRKKMIREILDCTTDESLNGTTVLNAYALLHGAHILRVHDVKEAVQAVKLIEKIKNSPL